MNPTYALRYPSGGSTLWLGDAAAAIAFRAEFFGVAAPAGGDGQVEVWSGSAWVRKPVKVWGGSAWVTKPLKYWNGSAWVNS